MFTLILQLTELFKETVILLRQILDVLRALLRIALLLARAGQTAGIQPPEAPLQGADTDTPASRYIVSPEGINAGLWMSCIEAWDLLGIAKSTLEERLNAGILKRYHKKGDEHLAKPRVWLMRSEVDAYYRDYTLLKGKEKK